MRILYLLDNRKGTKQTKPSSAADSLAKILSLGSDGSALSSYRSRTASVKMTSFHPSPLLRLSSRSKLIS